MSSKSIRFDDAGNMVKTEVGVKDINEVQGRNDGDGWRVDEVGEEAMSSRLANVKSQLEMNEEKDRIREKMRIKEKKLIKKQRDKEMNQVEPLPQVILGNSDEEEEDDE